MIIGDHLNCALQTILDALPCIEQDRYLPWIQENSTTEQDRAMIRARLATSTRLQSLSILLASDLCDERLRVTMRSLREQVYEGFEVVIACKPQNFAEHTQLAEDFSDLSIVIEAPKSGSFDCTNFENAAFAAASGDYVGFLAAGDQLAPEATAEVALALTRRPETIVIYSDEDWIDSSGLRSRPRFKTSWDFDAQLGFDLMGRFSPIRRDVLSEIGGLNPHCGLGAHYDLHCRVADYAGPLGILHLPSILRHALKQSKTSESLADSYAECAREVAARAISRRESIRAEVLPAPLAPRLNRVRWSDPDPLPMVSILMPTRDRADLFGVAARGILERTDYTNLELLILDNDSVEASTFKLFEQLSRDLRVRIVSSPGPFNYSRINNLGAKAADGDVLLLLNNDIDVIHPDWLREMVSLVMREEIGCVGAKLFYENGLIQHAGVSMAPHTGCAHVGRFHEAEDAGDCGSLAITRTYSAVTAACLAIRHNVFEELGGLDDVHLHIGYNDVDLCLRAADHGYRSVMTPFARLYHLESVSRGPNDNPAKRAQDKHEQARLVARWREVFLDDPYQSPNLHLAWEGAARLTKCRRLREWENLTGKPVKLPAALAYFERVGA